MLVNCVAYMAGKKIGDIPIDDISKYLSSEGCTSAPARCLPVEANGVSYMKVPVNAF